MYFRKKKSMEINELIKKYREFTGITQGILINEIKNTSGINLSLGTINGIEHTGSIADKNLDAYFVNRFYLNDIQADKEITDCTYKIALSCVEKDIQIDIEKLFSFTRLEELALFIIQLGIECNNSYLNNLSDFIEVCEGDNKIFPICLNKTAKYIYYIVYWYILLSHKEKTILKRENFSNDELCQIAEVFGYKEYATTSGQARGKINKSINKRLSLLQNIISIDIINKVSQFNICNLDDNLCKKESFKKLINNEINNLTLDELEEIIEISERFDIILQVCYAFCQGIIPFESPEYINSFIRKRFVSVSDSSNYQKLKPLIDGLIFDYNEYFKLYSKTDDESILKLLFRIRKILFNIYKSIESVEFNVFQIEEDKKRIDIKYNI